MAESCAVAVAGGFQAEFVETIPDFLSCSICFLPFRDPHLVSCCGAKFCEPCIGRVKSAGQPCPLCKQEFVSLLDRSLQRKVLEMSVYCSGKKNGCQWVGELRQIVSHERKECGWAVVECNYQCGAHLPRTLMDEHQRDECLQRPIDAKLESFTRRMEKQLEREIKKMETKLMTERGQHEKEMKEMDTKLKAERDQRELEIGKLESKLTAEREQHEREMKEMESKLTSKMATESEQHEKELITLKEIIEKIKNEQISRETSLQTEPQGLLNSIPVEFVMTQYFTYKRNNVPWYSPPFLTSRGGYMLCLRVDTNGRGDGAGTHISVHVCLMNSKHDSVRNDISRSFMNVSCDLDVQLEYKEDGQQKCCQTIHGLLLKGSASSNLRENKTDLGYGINKFIAHHNFNGLGFHFSDRLTWKVTCICYHYSSLTSS